MGNFTAAAYQHKKQYVIKFERVCASVFTGPVTYTIVAFPHLKTFYQGIIDIFANFSFIHLASSSV